MAELDLGARRDTRDLVPARPDRHARGVPRARGALPAARARSIARSMPRAASGTRLLSVVQVDTPDDRARPDGERPAALPGHRLPAVGAHRDLPVERGVRLPRPAARRHGAAGGAARPRAPSRSSRPAATSSPRATSSTGGSRTRAEACARASPTTGTGCPSWSPSTSRRPATRACSTSERTSSRRRRLPPRPRTPTSSRPSPRPPRRSTSTASARSRPDDRWARTACRSWAAATGTTA